MRKQPFGGSTGGGAAQGTVEERLARRFETELTRAERDYPKLRWLAGDEGGRSFRRSRPRLQVVVMGLAALTIVGTTVLGLAWRGQGGPAALAPAASGANPASTGAASPWVANPLAGVVVNGLPTHLDGAPVYQLWQKDKWAAESASFLLAGYKFGLANPCPSSAAATAATSGGPTDGELIPTCDGVELSPTSNNYTKDEQELAPFGSQALAGLTDGTAVVVRGHTRDPLSARCTDHGRSACEAALVVEDLVWQGSPDSRVAPDHDAFYDPLAEMSISGNLAAGSGTRVYGRGEDLPTSGSFLIRGQMVRSPASCDATPVPSAPIAWPICGNWSVAGHQMVQTGVDLDSLLGHEVILRVYGAGSTTVCASGEPRCRVLAAVEVVWVT